MLDVYTPVQGTSLVYNPRYLKHHKVEKLLLHQSLIFADKLLISAVALLRLRPTRFGTQVCKIVRQDRESFLSRFQFRFYGKAGVVRRKAVAQNALNE